MAISEKKRLPKVAVKATINANKREFFLIKLKNVSSFMLVIFLMINNMTKINSETWLKSVNHESSLVTIEI